MKTEGCLRYCLIQLDLLQRYWRLQNILRSKVAGGPIKPEVKGEIPSDLIENAEKQLAEETLKFKSSQRRSHDST